MNLYELARQIVCSIIAVALSMTVAAVESLLPHRPDWLERVEHLAFRLKTVRSGDHKPQPAPETDEAADREPELDPERLLRAYGELWQFVHALRSEGLSLDEGFCERVEREWSVSTLLTYMRNADRSLQEHASKALDTAALMFLPPIGRGNRG
ncbi:MAG: hypothetical protein GEU92_15030 [Alphaproteobacteria bacterium]|nr:hypothetical protein [Alphaproteobacteria bacterium]